MEFLSRWGDPQLDDRFYTHMPGWMLFNLRYFVHVGDRDDPQYGEIVGLSSNERDLMQTIMAFKFDTPNTLGAKPSIPTVAHILDIEERTVQRRKSGLIKKGALKVEYNTPRHDTDTYVFSEVVRQCRIWSEFWKQVVLADPMKWRERETYLQGDEGGDKNVTPVINVILGGDKNVTVGGDKNVTQRVIIEDLELVDISNDISTLTHQASKNDNAKLPPRGGVKPGTKRSKSTRVKRKSPKQVKKEARERLATWTKAIAISYNKESLWKGYDRPDDIKYTNQVFGMEVKAASTIALIYDEYVKRHPEIDISDITPEIVMGDYYGSHKKQNGWLFRRKFSDIDFESFTPRAMERYFAEYMTSKHGFARLVKKQQSSLPDTPSLTSPNIQEIDESKLSADDKAFLEWSRKRVADQDNSEK